MRNHRLPLAVTALVFALIASVSVSAQEESISLPDLSGDYTVSRTDFDLIDPTREEIFTEDADDQREIVLNVYYPAAAAPDAEFAPYMSDTLKTILNQQVGLPEVVLSMETHTYQDQPAASGTFPVLIFSPGFGSMTVTYTSLLEEVASHGYVVAALWHPYSLGMVEFEDGRLVFINEAGTNLAGNYDAIADVWTDDALFALDTLETLNQDDPILAGHLDFEHVGAFGHSFGGATAAEIAHDDARVDAAINMDGTMFGDTAASGVGKPFMMMQSEMAEPSDEELAAANMTRESFDQQMNAYAESVATALSGAQPGYQFLLKESLHGTYATDTLAVAQVLKEIVGPESIGNVDPQQAFDLISAYTVAFFDQELKGESSTLLASAADDANITLQTYNME